MISGNEFMSDFNGQKCNVCGAVNTTAALNWVRIFGITLGANRQPMLNATPPAPGTPRMAWNPMPKLDFCPLCAPKTTVDSLPAVLAKAQAAAQTTMQAQAQATVAERISANTTPVNPTVVK